MKIIDINFATEAQSKRAVSTVITLVLLCVVAVYTLYNANLYVSNRAQTVHYEESLAALEREAQAWNKKNDLSKVSVKDLKLLKSNMEFISSVTTRETFSWATFLSNLERYVPRNMFISQIKPDFGTKRIELVGVAKSAKAIFPLIDNLNESSNFANAILLKHSEVKSNTFKVGAGRGRGTVLFYVSADYRAEGIK